MKKIQRLAVRTHTLTLLAPVFFRTSKFLFTFILFQVGVFSVYGGYGGVTKERPSPQLIRSRMVNDIQSINKLHDLFRNSLEGIVTSESETDLSRYVPDSDPNEVEAKIQQHMARAVDLFEEAKVTVKLNELLKLEKKIHGEYNEVLRLSRAASSNLSKGSR